MEANLYTKKPHGESIALSVSQHPQMVARRYYEVIGDRGNRGQRGNRGNKGQYTIIRYATKSGAFGLRFFCPPRARP